MDICKTIRVKPWGEGQGDFVEINPGDFDPKFHTLMPGEKLPANRLTVSVDDEERDPLDHDGDGHKGGSMPHEAQAEAEPAGEAERPKPKRRVK